MPDVPGRDKLERKLAREIATVLSSGLVGLSTLLDNPDAIHGKLPRFFDDLAGDLHAAIMPSMQDVYLSQAEVLAKELTVGVDWGMVNKAAAEWASSYTFELVRGINDTTRSILQNALNSYYRDGLTVDELKQLLTPAFGPVRAEMISTTEITRASSQGELALARLIERENPDIRMTAIWQTNNDEIVCKICFPRNGKTQGDEWDEPPPAHPRCRCWLNHEMEVV